MKVWMEVEVNEGWRESMEESKMEWLGFLTNRVQRGIGTRGAVLSVWEGCMDESERMETSSNELPRGG
ncbi:MAG: hypothetical protein ACLFVK_06045 [Dehalococcoidia bacterium]